MKRSQCLLELEEVSKSMEQRFQQMNEPAHIEALEKFLIDDITWAVESGNKYPDRTMLGRSGQLIDLFALKFQRDDLNLFAATSVINNKKPLPGYSIEEEDVLLLHRMRKALLSASINLSKNKSKQEALEDIRYYLDDSYSEELFDFVCTLAKPCLQNMPDKSESS